MSNQPNDPEAVTIPPAAPPSEQTTVAPSEAASTAAPPTGPAAVPGYEILRELGRGGMGVVYQARHIQLNRVVALKMILAGGHAGEADLARFKTEGEAVARLQHPNIVQIFEVGEHGGLPYFSLEFCAGGSLDRKLAGTPLRPKEAAGLIETLARAIHAAHQQKVIHRDLKPANVLLTEDGTPKITDFGLAKKLDAAGQTQSGAVMGTPSYMAPEQAGGKSKEMGPATDVYALGAILYECLTGRPPFKAATPLDTILQVVADEPAPPRRLQSKIPADLETICLKCLRKEPAKRYASAAALAEDLRRFQIGEPVKARPVGMMGRMAKWVRRRPLVAGLLAAVVVVAAVGFAAFWRQYGETVRKDRTLARTYFQKSADEYRYHNIRDGLSWMLRAYEADPDNDDLRDKCLEEINWRQSLPDVLLGQDGGVDAASFSADGRIVFTAGGSSARLWDVQSGQELQRLSQDGGVRAASFSPDGRTVVTASLDHTACLWDVQSGKELLRLPHDGAVLAASFSSDGRTVVTASLDHTARLWDAQSGKQLVRLLHEGPVGSASFSSDGRTVLTYTGTGSLPGTVPAGGYVACLWDAQTGQELQRLAHGAIRSASLSPDGRTVLTASEDKTARLWDAQSGKELQQLAHSDRVWSASFSPDGRTVVTASEDKTARLWDTQSGKELQRLTHEDAVYAASFRPDSRTVLTLSGPIVHLWDAQSGKELQRLNYGDTAGNANVTAACFSPDGRTVLIASNQASNQGNGTAPSVWGAVSMWQIQFGQLPHRVNPERLRAWVLVRTLQDFDDMGQQRFLTREQWQRQRQILDANGGDWLKPYDPKDWHLSEAADAEKAGHWFAARFHLNQLLAADPNNADLLHRRDVAVAHLVEPLARCMSWEHLLAETISVTFTNDADVPVTFSAGDWPGRKLSLKPKESQTYLTLVDVPALPFVSIDQPDGSTLSFAVEHHGDYSIRRDKDGKIRNFLKTPPKP